MSVSVLVPCNFETPSYRARVWAWCRERWGPDIEIVTGYDPGVQGEFSHACAINAAAASASGEVFVITEADIALDPPDWAQRAAAKVAAGEELWLRPQWYTFVTEAATARLLQADQVGGAEIEVDWVGKGLSWCGALVVPRAAFELVGGYDERFSSWSGDDVAFAMSLTALYGPSAILDGRALHLWHSRDGLDRTPAELGRLMHRYIAARDDPAAMRALIAERAEVTR